jgi:hypothetical protein
MLWVDDDLEDRPTPPGWLRACSVNEAIAILAEGAVDYLSLDHDLGDYAHDGGDGIRVADWMEAHNIWPRRGLNVHSVNPVGMTDILRAVDCSSPYPLGYTRSRGDAPPGGWPSVLR